MVKFKSRYILLEMLFDNNSGTPDTNRKIESSAMLKILKLHVERLFGDKGLGQISKNLQVKYVNNVTNLMILRVGKEFVNILWTVLTLMNEIDGDKVKMHIMGVCGTIKKCELKAKEYLEGWTISYEKNKAKRDV